MSTYYELHDMKDVRIVKEVQEVMCGDHLVPVEECGCLR